MNTLFSILPQFPQGFEYVPDFIKAREEEKLLQTIKTIPVHPMLFQGYEAKRKVASFGQDWSFEKRILSKGKEIPKEFDWLIKKLADHLSLRPQDFAELLVKNTRKVQ